MTWPIDTARQPPKSTDTRPVQLWPYESPANGADGGSISDLPHLTAAAET